MQHQSGELVIPVSDSNLAVVVSLDALPEDENDILQILQAEQAPLRLWVEFANAYLACGKKEQFQRVLEDGCHPGAWSAVGAGVAGVRTAPGVC